MISKNTIKHIHSLSLKKFRTATGTFVAEGPKATADLLPLLPCEALYVTPDGLRHLEAKGMLQQAVSRPQLVEVSQSELERLSLLKAPREMLGVFDMPQGEDRRAELVQMARSQLCLALDGVQDPGNLGTIIRIADWFGIEHIFASPDTADAYAPKVVQATMGAIGRVRIHYLPLAGFLCECSNEVPVYGTFLNGENIHAKQLATHGIIVMGNEGKGITPEVGACVSERLFIPNYPAGRATSESLNVAVATAIICSEFRRRA